MHHPRTWSTRRRLTLAAAGLAAAAAVAVPGVALAGGTTTTPASTASTAAPSTCTPAQRWDALAVAAPKVSAYLDAHPDLSAELQTLKALPKDQRAAAAKTYFSAHPDERTALRGARADLRTFRATCHG